MNRRLLAELVVRSDVDETTKRYQIWQSKGEQPKNQIRCCVCQSLFRGEHAIFSLENPADDSDRIVLRACNECDSQFHESIAQFLVFLEDNDYNLDEPLEISLENFDISPFPSTVVESFQER